MQSRDFGVARMGLWAGARGAGVTKKRSNAGYSVRRNFEIRIFRISRKNHGKMREKREETIEGKKSRPEGPPKKKRSEAQGSKKKVDFWYYFDFLGVNTCNMKK